MRRKDTPIGRPRLLPILIIVVIGLVVGIARGGSLATLGRARLRLVPLVFVGLAVQIAALFFTSRSVAVAMTAVASGGVLAFAAANVRRPGMVLIAVGAVMNLTVVLANGGMPLSRGALGRAGLDDPFISGRPPAVHRLLDENTRLRFLGDVIPMPAPVGKVFSPGDVVLWTGLLLVVQSLTLPRGRRRLGARTRGDFPVLPELDK
jgi:hypothetical protein